MGSSVGFFASIGPNAPHTAYSAAKFAVKGFTEALITDLRVNAPHIKCSVVMPGHIGTNIVANSRMVLAPTARVGLTREPYPGRRGPPYWTLKLPFDLEIVESDPDAARYEAEARAEMLQRYLDAFGPASRPDMDRWSMMRQPAIKAALTRLERLRRFRDEYGRELLDVERSPLPDSGTPAPVRFLPKWDNVLLAYADRTRVLPEEYRRVVIKSNGDVAQTFLVDGFVAGIWRVEEGRVVTEPFAPLPLQRDRLQARGDDAVAARLERPPGAR